MVEMVQRRAASWVLNRFERKDGETEMLSNAVTEDTEKVDKT